MAKKKKKNKSKNIVKRKSTSEFPVSRYPNSVVKANLKTRCLVSKETSFKIFQIIYIEQTNLDSIASNATNTQLVWIPGPY